MGVAASRLRRSEVRMISRLLPILVVCVASALSFAKVPSIHKFEAMKGLVQPAESVLLMPSQVAPLPLYEDVGRTNSINPFGKAGQRNTRLAFLRHNRDPRGGDEAREDSSMSSGLVKNWVKFLLDPQPQLIIET